MSSQEFRPYVVCIVHLNSYVRFQKLNVRMYEVSRTNLLVLGPYYHLLFSRKKTLVTHTNCIHTYWFSEITFQIFKLHKVRFCVVYCSFIF